MEAWFYNALVTDLYIVLLFKNCSSALFVESIRLQNALDNIIYKMEDCIGFRQNAHIIYQMLMFDLPSVVHSFFAWCIILIVSCSCSSWEISPSYMSSGVASSPIIFLKLLQMTLTLGSFLNSSVAVVIILETWTTSLVILWMQSCSLLEKSYVWTTQIFMKYLFTINVFLFHWIRISCEEMPVCEIRKIVIRRSWFKQQPGLMHLLHLFWIGSV